MGWRYKPFRGSFEVWRLVVRCCRCFLRRGGRTVDSDPEGSESSLALPPREIYLVVHPGKPVFGVR